MNALRVTGGRFKGRMVQVPKGPYDIRPAMDRMRESLFSILGDLTGLSFLDLFAGSGIMAIEAASRGAGPIVCVERDRAKLGTLIRNVAIADERIVCRCMPVERFIDRCDSRFALIFCDPPFPYAFKAALLDNIGRKGLLASGGRLLIHYPAGDVLPEVCGNLTSSDERGYGRSMVRFYDSTA
jgi:16S rRNA (guanine(966)-N(2))-methyltransferase RsmD